jgi:hypothetical protein
MALCHDDPAKGGHQANLRSLFLISERPDAPMQQAMSPSVVQG